MLKQITRTWLGILRNTIVSVSPPCSTQVTMQPRAMLGRPQTMYSASWLKPQITTTRCARRWTSSALKNTSGKKTLVKSKRIGQRIFTPWYSKWWWTPSPPKMIKQKNCVKTSSHSTTARPMEVSISNSANSSRTMDTLKLSFPRGIDQHQSGDPLQDT